MVSLSAFLNASGSREPSTQFTLSGRTSLTENGNSIRTKTKDVRVTDGAGARSRSFELERERKEARDNWQLTQTRKRSAQQQLQIWPHLQMVPLCTAPAHHRARGEVVRKTKSPSGKRSRKERACEAQCKINSHWSPNRMASSARKWYFQHTERQMNAMARFKIVNKRLRWTWFLTSIAIYQHLLSLYKNIWLFDKCHVLNFYKICKL